MKADEIALHLGTAVLSPFLSALFGKLDSPILRYAGYLLNAEDDMRSLKTTLSKIQILVSKAEMQHAGDPGLAIWLREIKEVAYEAEDVLDKFATVAMKLANAGPSQPKEVLTRMQGNFKAKSSFKGIQAKLTKIAEQKRDLTLFEPPHETRHLRVPEWRMTSSLPPEGCMIGREDDHEKLVELLVYHGQPTNSGIQSASQQTTNLHVLPIVAMGGMGKTALARSVYNDPRVERRFQMRMWVCVSSDFNLTRITTEVIESASYYKLCETVSWNKLQTILKKTVRVQRFLLVLDDVWCENAMDWERLLAPLRFGRYGSRILITTRSKKVADITATMNPFFLGPLREEDCWKLLKALVFGNNTYGEHPELEKIGQDIVKKLKGVPLAVKTIGGLLHSNLDENVWTAILESEIWRLPQTEYDIMPALGLTYQHMPAHLKACFRYCSLFPEGFEFDETTLVLLWMAQGFIQPQRVRRLEDIGREYLNDLLLRSFLEQKENGKYSMHDLMYELAQYVSVDECVVIEGRTHGVSEKVLHSSLQSASSFKFEDVRKFLSLRTLLTLTKSDRWSFKDVTESLFSSLKYLRVLDLGHSDIVHLPPSIGSLEHLRYLDLSSTCITELPDQVGELYNLQTLRLTDCPLPVLPERINELVNLRHLEGKAALLSKVGGIRNMTSLQELVKFEVSTEDGHRLEELKGMTELGGKLHICNLENVTDEKEANEAKLNNKKYLHSLELDYGYVTREVRPCEGVLQGLEPHQNLKCLIIRGNGDDAYPKWLANGDLCNLEYVSLVRCQRWTILPPLKQLPLLKHLEIEGIKGVQMLDAEFWGDKGFPLLEVLKINNMNISVDSWGEHHTQLFPSLRVLEIRQCSQLMGLPTLPATLEILKLSNLRLAVPPKLWESNEALLRELDIRRCSQLTELPTLPATLEILKLSNLRLAVPPKLCESNEALLRELDISDCPQLRALPILPRTLKTLKLSNVGLTALPTMSGYDGASSSSSDSSSLLSQLTEVYISDCPDLESLQKGLLQHHHGALNSLDIVRCKKLMLLPADGSRSLSCLRSLKIDDCPQLTTLPIGDGPSSSTALHKLPVLNQIYKLTSLVRLSIRYCPKLESLPAEGLRYLKKLEMLTITNCDMLEALQIEALCSLKNLSIRFCRMLGCLTEDNKPLPSSASLKSITIRNCERLELLPGLDSLSFLAELSIGGCSTIQSFPALPNTLGVLLITGCPTLLKLYNDRKVDLSNLQNCRVQILK